MLMFFVRKIEVENDESALELQEAVDKGEAILKQIHHALHDISTKQLEMDQSWASSIAVVLYIYRAAANIR